MPFHDRLIAHVAAIEGEFVVSEEAEKFLAFMREHHPDELDIWLSERETWLVGEEMRFHLRSERARDRAHAGARAFADHLSLDDTPDDTDPFAVRYCIDDAHTWRAVGDMTGSDHHFVAAQYQVTGKRALARAAFHEVVAKRVGKRRTAQVMSVEQYERLRREIEGM